MGQKIITAEQLQQHAAAKAKLMNAGRGVILDSRGNPVGTDANVQEGEVLEPMGVNLASTPLHEKESVMELVLVQFLEGQGIISSEGEGEPKLNLHPDELADRGMWLINGPTQQVMGFEWDEQLAIVFIH